jgi:drug/metabolite transporter (DMT)-like permease
LLFTCIGIILLSRTLNNTPKWPAQISQAAFYPILMPLLSAFLFGSSVYLAKYILNSALANPFSYYYIRAPLIAACSALMLRPNLHWITPRRLALTAGRSLFVIAQWLAFLYAVDLGNAALVKAVSEITPLFVLLLSAVLFKEKLTSLKLIGAGLIVAGLLALSVA